MMEEREAHYIQHLGPLEMPVMHSTDLKDVHVDVYTFPPSEDRPFYTLITRGMSDLRQCIPDDQDIAPRAELMMYVEEPKNWMYSVLKGLAEMPSESQTFLSHYHTVPNGMPMTAEPSLLTSFFLFVPYLDSPDFFTTMTVEGDRTDFLLVIPITEAERELAVDQGSEALLDLFQKHNFIPIVEEHRSCLVSHQTSPGAPQ